MPVQRRQFFRLAAVAGLAPLVRPQVARSAHPGHRPGFAPVLPGALPRAPLIKPPVLRGPELLLRAQEQSAEIAPGVMARVWSPGPGPVGPTIEGRTGDQLRIRLDNALPESTILHWHGLRVPEAADGHPRLAIAPGGRYDYDVPLIDRAGTYWYHSHAHHRTGIQAYRGMAGMLLIRDEHEDRLGLPGGDHELPMLVQDRRLAADGTFEYEPVMHEQMEGYFGDAPFVNGIRLPSQDVETTTYRLRIANATSSRILRLALSNGASFTLIGVDGGLLEAPVTLPTIDLGTGERVDVLVNFARERVGSTVSLLSAAFPSPARMGGMGMGRGMGGGMGRMGAGGVPQGGEMTLVEFRVTRSVSPVAWRPVPMPRLVLPDARRASKTRTFSFESAMMRHGINGRTFDMERMDETVRFGDTELWTFVNDSPFPHPVHVHETQFHVLERTGGRAEVMPWERGLKDTVLVLPGERVSVAATFDSYRGRFLMHCHNMIHEDMGMMLNFAIE